MKILVSLLFVGCLCSCSCIGDDGQKITELLTKNTEELSEANALLSSIDTVGKRIESNLEAQRKALQVIGLVEQLLAKQNDFLEAQAEALLETFANSSRQGHEYAKRTQQELHDLTRLQEGTKHLILHLEAKLDAYQKHLIQSARGIDRSIDGLTKLVTRSVLPQLNGLQCSFDSLETAQINIEVELKSLSGVKELSEDTNNKLGILDHQLKHFNRTQEARLEALTSAVRHLRPLNTRHIEAALRDLIISQKRIELDVENCGKHSHQHNPRPESHSPSYGPTEHQHPHHAPQPESHYSSYTHQQHGSQQESHHQGYGNIAPQPHHHEQQHYQQQASAKPVDVVQVWSIKEPQKHGERPENHRVSAYAESPEPKAKHASWSETHQSSGPVSAHSVSWQQPLPWEEASPYQSAPSPNHPHEHPHRPVPLPLPQKPCQKGHSKTSPQSYKPQQVSVSGHEHVAQPGESYRIWYADDSIKDAY
ncbi:uncharacterized protein LOC117587931 [Drosophila guanche]|uniref:Uncharacterized protein n=1 Tax=Drosophila guanche TaxID=7266 RepID=A0A3B0JYG3_DROGU|nr:uncharacterized protein LOC117587931 [Drosophila guanche]SPP85472.1 Hypothetical predicted protein [Drosophila guanche]